MILNTKPSIVFVSAFNAPFIQDDLDFLEKNFTVNKQIGHGMLAVLKIIFAVLQCDLVFCWFASVYAVIGVAVGRILGVKSLVVVGGVDVAREKELNYGIWLSTWRATLVGYGLRNAHQVLVVDPSLKEDAVRLADYDGRNILYLATGYDSTFWRPVGEKEPTVLTVAVAREENRLKLKGIDVLVEVARRLP